MMDLYNQQSKDNFHQYQRNLFQIEFTIYYKFYQKEEDLFIDEIYYHASSKHDLVNAYLNLLYNRSLALLDRVSIKEFDYFLRQDNSVPYFDKISKELLDLMALGEEIKKRHVKKAAQEKRVYQPEVHGPIEFMSFGELIELVEEIISHKDLVNFNLSCTNVEDLKVYLKSNDELSIKDKEFISKRIKELGHDSFEVDI